MYFLLSLSPLCQSFHLSFCHFVTLSHSILSLTTLSLCQSFHLFFDHFVTLSSFSILLFTILPLFSVFPSFFSPLFLLCQSFLPYFYYFVTLSDFPSYLSPLCQSFHPSFHLFVTFRAAPVEKTPGSQGWIFLSHRYFDDAIIAILKLFIICFHSSFMIYSPLS